MLKKGVKKAQVALFVIIAIILIAAIIIFLSLKPGIKKIPRVTEPQAYIEKCMKDAASEALELISKQGGSLEPRGYALYGNRKVAYLCYTRDYYTPCTNIYPMLKYHVENEITSYIFPKVRECVNTLERELIARGYVIKVDEDNINIVTTLIPRKVVIDANIPLTITKEETKKFEKFKATVLWPIYDHIILAQDIVNSEVEYGNYDQLSYMLYKPNVDIEKKRVGENTIYVVRDRGTGKRFLFAVRSYVMPPGF